MKLLLLICGIISLLINGFSIYYAIKLYYSETRAKRVLSSIQIYTIGLFLSVVAIFIPIYYMVYSFGDKYTYLRPLLMSIHNSLRIFILDGDFDIIKNSLCGQPEWLRVSYSLYSAFLYVIAPIMTFTNVLSLFKNIKGELRFWYHKYKKIYVMSELNQRSVALAKSIREDNKKAVIVFTDVFEQNEEDDYELLTQVRDIKAICLKRDVAHLNIASKKGDVEIFLIGEDEGENVSQAVKITTELNSLNKKYNIKIFVFSNKESSAYILDSIRYDNLLKITNENKVNINPLFKLRRINEVRQLVWKTVSEMNVFEVANNNVISVLIAGMGSYGMEFFKTLIWFCQFEGYKLRITIIDKRTDGEDGKRSIKSIIEHQCPELLYYNMTDDKGEAYYDIKVLTDIDLETATFDKIAFYSGEDEEKCELAQRIKETNIAIVSLGDDDLNIETSVKLRSMFDKLHMVKATKEMLINDEQVQIYSIVYDEQKSGILHSVDSMGDAAYLVNHCDVPYHIHFIGGLNSQFSYTNIYDEGLEENAYRHHLSWVDIEKEICELLKNDKNISEEDKDRYSVYLEELKKYDEPEKQVEEQLKYEKHEYYRLSSMAKELYQKAIAKNFSFLIECKEKGQNGQMLQTCMCENCVRRKKSEHMRWNAYTRVIGYSYKEGLKAYRAKLHNNLVSWDKLSDYDKMKD